MLPNTAVFKPMVNSDDFDSDSADGQKKKERKKTTKTAIKKKRIIIKISA